MSPTLVRIRKNVGNQDVGGEQGLSRPWLHGEGSRGEAARTALQAWQEADDRARAAEARVRDASQLREAEGTPIPEDLLREMLRTRAEANARLREAIALAGR